MGGILSGGRPAGQDIPGHPLCDLRCDLPTSRYRKKTKTGKIRKISNIYYKTSEYEGGHMIPQSKEELENIISECKAMATKRAMASAAIGAAPVPVVDIAADVAILINVLPVINSKFGLSKDQIATYDEKFQINY